MNIVLFQDLTTNEILTQLEADAAKYDGLYVDMENKSERKFVKDSAATIGDIRKKLDRARIDLCKVHKIAVDHEFKEIDGRLETANLVFSKLIDDHKAQRAIELEREKALQLAKDIAYQLPFDHDEAVSMNKFFDFEKAEKIREQKERDEAIAKKASEQANKDKVLAEERAEQLERDLIMQQEKAKRDEDQRKIDDEAREVERVAQIEADKKQAEIEKFEAGELAKFNEIARQAEVNRKAQLAKDNLESNKKHVSAIRCDIKKQLMVALNINEIEAKNIVLALLKIKQITINY